MPQRQPPLCSRTREWGNRLEPYEAGDVAWTVRRSPRQPSAERWVLALPYRHVSPVQCRHRGLWRGGVSWFLCASAYSLVQVLIWRWRTWFFAVELLDRRDEMVRLRP